MAKPKIADIQIQKQVWSGMTRYIFWTDGASVQLELYDTPQKWGKTAFIYSLWVNEECRLQGKATVLLDVAERTAKQAGHKSVALEWEYKNTPHAILDYYIRRGYEQILFDGNGEYSVLEKVFWKPKNQ